MWRIKVAVLHIIGVLMFLSGFLLTRRELQDLGTCPTKELLDCQNADEQCRLRRIEIDMCSSALGILPDYELVVILIVDALRFDFSTELPSITEALNSHPNHTRLFQFVADAPTTTMQRLKGLTTGGLPTFVDMGRSFDAGIDLQEDNWLHQVYFSL
jgi:phosphatidylinositol glycan class O